ncbi:uncharacterized protein LOC119068037 [Bradysia coprophila]|uniref:uncharacterized protein LOC119068037 n=1 Tax=Bradysia coprophila TaxID=38358 RepID=UPI00187DA4A2|nr:uncharacterized protein LOC119068037 [Bradysia coprophila]
MDRQSFLTIDHLPTEVLDKIFSYLTFYDVKAVKGVCRRWLDITLHSSYTRHNKINIRNFKFLPRDMGERPDDSVAGLSFIYQTVKLNYKEYAHSEYDEFERSVKLFMKFNGENVKNLTLIDFHATKEPRLYKLCSEIIDATPNLESLCLNNTQFDRRLFLNETNETNRGARNLKQLSLVPWSLRLVEYDQLEDLEKNCPKLLGLTWLNAHTFLDDKALAFFRSISRRLKTLKIHNVLAEDLMLEKNFPVLSEFRLISLDIKFDTSVVPEYMFAKFVEFINNQKDTLTDLTLYCSDVMMQYLNRVYSTLTKLEPENRLRWSRCG